MAEDALGSEAPLIISEDQFNLILKSAVEDPLFDLLKSQDIRYLYKVKRWGYPGTIWLNSTLRKGRHKFGEFSVTADKRGNEITVEERRVGFFQSFLKKPRKFIVRVTVTFTISVNGTDLFFDEKLIEELKKDSRVRVELRKDSYQMERPTRVEWDVQVEFTYNENNTTDEIEVLFVQAFASHVTEFEDRVRSLLSKLIEQIKR